MTITVSWLDPVSYSAKNFRQGQGVLFGNGTSRVMGARSGFRLGTGAVVSSTTTTWTVTPFIAAVDPGAALYNGLYQVAVDANVTGALTAPHATLPRKDIIYLTINDTVAGDGSGASSGQILYTAGTAAASPSAPATPARSFLLATLNVPASGGGNPTTVMNSVYSVAAGGVWPVASSTERDALTAYSGMEVARTDVTSIPVEIYNGSSWVRRIDSASLNAVANYTISGWVTKIETPNGKIVTVAARIALTAGSTGALSSVTFPVIMAGIIPTAYRSAASHVFDGELVDTATISPKATLRFKIFPNGDLGASHPAGTEAIDAGEQFYLSTTYPIL